MILLQYGVILVRRPVQHAETIRGHIFQSRTSLGLEIEDIKDNILVLDETGGCENRQKIDPDSKPVEGGSYYVSKVVERNLPKLEFIKF